MINSELIKLLYDYSKNERVVDKEYIDKVIEIVVKNRDLNNYVKKTIFFNDGARIADSAAAYDSVNMRIEIYYDDIINFISNLHCDKDFLNPLEKNMFINLIITHTILHELEHAYQNKISDNPEDDSDETNIIRADFLMFQALRSKRFNKMMENGDIKMSEINQYIRYKQLLYDQYYDFSTSERLAEINTFETIMETLKQIEEKVPILLGIQTAYYDEKMLSGYPETFPSCPTEIYLKGTLNSDIWKNLSFYDDNTDIMFRKASDKYDSKKRLKYGLPMIEDEHLLCKIFKPHRL